MLKIYLYISSPITKQHHSIPPARYNTHTQSLLPLIDLPPIDDII